MAWLMLFFVGLATDDSGMHVELLPSFQRVAIDLGELQTGESKKIVVSYTNSTEAPVVFNSGNSCCGVSLGYRKGTQVKPGAKSDFSLRFSAGLRAGDFRKTVQLVNDKGQKWDVQLRAVIRATHVLIPDKISLGPDDPRDKIHKVVIKPTRGPQDFQLKALSGFIHIKDTKRIGNEWEITFTVRDEVRADYFPVFERIAITPDGATSATSTLDLQIVPPSRFVHRPSLLRFTWPDIEDAKECVGKGLLFGPPDALTSLPEVGGIEIFDSGGKSICTGTARVLGRSKTRMGLEYKLPESAGSACELSGLRARVSLGKNSFQIKRIDVSSKLKQ